MIFGAGAMKHEGLRFSCVVDYGSITDMDELLMDERDQIPHSTGFGVSSCTGQDLRSTTEEIEDRRFTIELVNDHLEVNNLLRTLIWIWSLDYAILLHHYKNPARPCAKNVSVDMGEVSISNHR